MTRLAELRHGADYLERAMPILKRAGTNTDILQAVMTDLKQQMVSIQMGENDNG